jgi:hypothetical protein
MTTNTTVFLRARAWCVIEDTAKELGVPTDQLIRAMEDGNLAAQLKAARSVVANPNDTSDQNYDLAMSLKALGVLT